MALIFLDSFDHYTKPQFNRKWNTGSPNSIDTTNGRTGKGANIGTFGNIGYTFGPEYQSLACGMAIRLNGYGNDPIAFQSDVGASCAFGTNGDGRYFYKCDGGSSAPSSFVLNLREWYYIELQDTVSFSLVDSTHYSISHVGSLRVNEATISTGSFSRTVSGAVPGSSRGYARLALTGPGGSLNCSIDDLYLTDGELLGDIKIGVLYPNAAGDSSAWTPAPTAANYANVMEHISDDDATIVSAASVGLKDLYNLDNIPPSFTGTIKGVQALWLVKKTDAGSAFVKGVWKSGGTEIVQSQGYNYVSPNGYPPSYVDYLYSHEGERVSLFTSSDWSVSEVNALQLGLTRTV